MATVVAAGPFVYDVLATGLTKGYLFQGGDQAVIELAIRRALQFQQLLGPYDRFGWHHPGPIYFYLLSIPYLLLGPGARPEIVGQVVLEGLAVVGIVVVVNRRAGAVAALSVAALVLLYCWTIQVPRLNYPWNPLVVVLPMILVAVLAGVAMTGSTMCLLGAALVGTFTVQTDVATAPLTALLLVTAGATLIVQWKLNEDGPREYSRRTRAWAGLGVALLLALWIAPIVQQAAGPGPSNLSLIVQFFSSAHPHASLRSATYAVAAVDSLLPFGAATVLGQGIQSPAPIVIMVLVSLAGLVGIGLGWIRRRWLAVSFGVISMMGLVGSIVSVSRIVGGIMGYDVLWEVAFPMVGVFGLVVALGGSWVKVRSTGASVIYLLGQRVRGVLSLVLAGATVTIAVALALQVGEVGYPPAILDGSEVAQAWQLVSPYLPSPPSSVLVNMVSNAQYFVGAGLVDRLASLGFTAVVPTNWSIQFGSAQVAHGSPQVTIELRTPSASAPPHFTFVGDVGSDIALYVS
ncbi:MAG: hypothetical protein ACRDWV_00985 [Acidimicrobiales bacterium]